MNTRYNEENNVEVKEVTMDQKEKKLLGLLNNKYEYGVTTVFDVDWHIKEGRIVGIDLDSSVLIKDHHIEYVMNNANLDTLKTVDYDRLDKRDKEWVFWRGVKGVMPEEYMPPIVLLSYRDRKVDHLRYYCMFADSDRVSIADVFMNMPFFIKTLRSEV